MNIADRLKTLREERKYTIKQCADFIGVSQSTYREWEYGRSISGEPYLKITELFEITLSELFGQQGDELKEKINFVEETLKHSLKLVINIKSFL